MSSPVEETHFIVLPGGGYATHAENEAEPIADWLGELGIRATVLRYPLNASHPVPLDAVRSEAVAKAVPVPHARASTNAGLDPHVATHLLVAHCASLSRVRKRLVYETTSLPHCDGPCSGAWGPVSHQQETPPGRRPR
jgi:hypothetical protein